MSIDLSRLEALASRIPRPVRNTNTDWYCISDAASDRAQVMLFGPIDDWDGTSAVAFTKELNAITARNIDLYVNSPGGMVFEAVAIFSALKRHPARIDVHIDGLAASAASFVAMAGDSIEIEKPAKMMIHDAQGFTMGGPAEHREMLALLDELSDTIAQIYAERTKKPAKYWRDAMSATTWYGATEAVQAGLADRVAGETDGTTNSLKSQLIRARARVALERVR